MPDFAYTLFAIDIVILLILLPGAGWSIALPDSRIRTPPLTLLHGSSRRMSNHGVFQHWG